MKIQDDLTPTTPSHLKNGATFTWYHYKNFGDIPPLHLYQIFQLRQQVFMLEQNCLYPDIDELDLVSEHLLITESHPGLSDSGTQNELGTLSTEPIQNHTPFNQQDHNTKDMTSSQTVTEMAAATLRIVPAGCKLPDLSLGRIVVRKDARGWGIGEKIVRYALNYLKNSGTTIIRIEAQHHLERWYGLMGFTTCSHVFDLDGIPHVQMVCHIDPS